jgi:predicted RNA-binding Zn-ribbon protein involved in translation (DUF1610 family)
MSCLICSGPAAVGLHEAYQERVCPDCGSYRVTRNAIALLRNNNFRFDVHLSRSWLAQQRGSGVIPTIDSHEAVLLGV